MGDANGSFEIMKTEGQQLRVFSFEEHNTFIQQCSMREFSKFISVCDLRVRQNELSMKGMKKCSS